MGLLVMVMSWLSDVNCSNFPSDIAAIRVAVIVFVRVQATRAEFDSLLIKEFPEGWRHTM